MQRWANGLGVTSAFASASTQAIAGRGQTLEFELRPAIQDRQRGRGIVVRVRGVRVSSAGHLELERPLRGSEL